MAYHVTVRDTYCGIKGRYADEAEVTTIEEAKQWAKQFREEYPCEDGYSVKITTTN